MLKIAKFGFSLFGINTYVVYDPSSKDAAVIDPGMFNAAEFEAMAAFIEREGLKVRYLINTHMHIDHAVGDKWIEDTFSVPLSAHEGDAPLGVRLAMQAAEFGLPGAFDGVEIGIALKEGDTIEIGNGHLSVIHVPGHSPGSIALYDKEDGFIIVGDILFRRSIGRTDLPGGNYRQLIDGINSKLLKLPDTTVVYPGHGEPTTIGEERLGNPFLA